MNELAFERNNIRLGDVPRWSSVLRDVGTGNCTDEAKESCPPLTEIVERVREKIASFGKPASTLAETAMLAELEQVAVQAEGGRRRQAPEAPKQLQMISVCSLIANTPCMFCCFCLAPAARTAIGPPFLLKDSHP